MRTTRWLETIVAAMVALTLHGTGTGIDVEGGSPGQREVAAWAVERFAIAGLDLPGLEIRLHPDRDGCRGRLGFYSDGVANLCATQTSQIAVRTMVHELAHGWLDAYASTEDRGRFLALRSLRTWNDQDVPWDQRGYEQAAEILAWALHDQGTGIHAPRFPGNSPPELAEAFRSLTGAEIPRLPLGGGPERSG